MKMILKYCKVFKVNNLYQFADGYHIWVKADIE